MAKELKELRKLYPIESEQCISLKEKDIDSLSMLLFSDASYEYITHNLLNKRKFNILIRNGVFEKMISIKNRVTYRISPEYRNQVRDIYVKYYRAKFSKL